MWFSINATGGTFCEDNVNVTLQMSNKREPDLLQAGRGHRQRDVHGSDQLSGTAAIVEPSGSYTDGSTVTLELQKTCSTSRRRGTDVHDLRKLVIG